MSIDRVSPDEAQRLMSEEGYTYLDVRSVPEFEAGHPTGAYNVPLLDMGPRGMAANPDFLAVVEKTFPRESKLVIGCKSGGRSLQAADLLAKAGYLSVIDQRSGFDGNQELGWRPRGLPVSTDAESGRSYQELKG